MSEKTSLTKTNALSCPLCGSAELDDFTLESNLVCSNCGLVISDELTIDPTQLRQLGTPEEQLTWAEHYKVSSSTEQQVASALSFLEDIANRLSLSTEARERAAELYGQAAIQNATDGRLAALVVAAIIVHTTRELRSPLPIGRVSGAADVEIRSLEKLIRKLPRELEFEPRACRPAEYLPYLCEELEMDSSVSEQAQELLSELERAGVTSGRHPLGIAAAAVYRASDGVVTQRAVAAVAGVTEETVRVRLLDHQELEEYHE